MDRVVKKQNFAGFLFDNMLFPSNHVFGFLNLNKMESFALNNWTIEEWNKRVVEYGINLKPSEYGVPVGLTGDEYKKVSDELEKRKSGVDQVINYKVEG